MIAATAALLCALSTTVPVEPSAPWTAQPAAGGRPYVYLEGPPGTVLQDTLSVTNPGDRPLTVRVAVREDGPAARIALASERLTIPPRTRADIPFALTVPAAAVPGDHSAAIVAAAAGRRSAVPVRLRISGPSLAALSVEDVRLDGERINYTLVNRGNTVLKPRLAVRARGLTGQLMARPARRLPVTLPPGGRAELTEPWPDPPALDSVDVSLLATAAGGAHAEGSAEALYLTPGGAASVGALGLGAVGGGTAVLRGVCARRRTRCRHDDGAATAGAVR
ncbi:hypothetical protein V1460_32110 [Streptomyces sp. SCSIO 30461]|uniref:COG1470 family protein n=1 Tax=Streptomyces sp. SCSIO 30461 TaxID=3118085 RepID=UPI0030D1A1E0